MPPPKMMLKQAAKAAKAAPAKKSIEKVSREAAAARALMDGKNCAPPT